MTTYAIYTGARLHSTTHSRELAEQLAAVIRDGHVELIERELTAGELMRDEQVAA